MSNLSSASAASLAPENNLSLNKKIAIVASLLAVYIIWGSTYLGILFAIESYPPMLMLGIRFSIAGVLFYSILRWRGAPKPTLAEWKGAAIVGGFLLGGGNGLVTITEQWVSSGLAALVVGTMPLWVALFSGLFGRWPSLQEWLGLLLGFIGIVLLNFESDLRANPLGAFLLILSAASWAFGSVYSKHLSLPKGMMSSATQMLIVGPSFLILGFLSGERIVGTPSMLATSALIYLIFAALIAFSAYNYLLQNVRPAVATSYAYINPVIAVGLGILFANESIGLLGLIAMGIIIAAVVLVLLKRK
jgi:drug/metabolite transporter (DMT)-like permease